MKNKLILCIQIILAGLILVSCYTDLNMNDYRTEPITVLNCAVSSDTFVMTSVSRTWFFSEKNPNVTLPDAQVELYINGNFVEQMQWKDTVFSNEYNSYGLYVSSIVPRAGDVVKVVATTKFGTAWAEDIVPVKVGIEDVKYTVRNIPSNNNSITFYPGGVMNTSSIEITYEITFQDNANSEDYYLIKVKGLDHATDLYHIDFSYDPIFTTKETILDGAIGKNPLYFGNSRTFTDEIINGKRYTLKLIERYSLDYKPENELGRKISLYKLSKPYYRYLHSLQNISEEKLMNNMAELGLAEPMYIFSNVQGGTGILGACQRSDSLIYVKNLPTN